MDIGIRSDKLEELVSHLKFVKKLKGSELWLAIGDVVYNNKTEGIPEGILKASSDLIGELREHDKFKITDLNIIVERGRSGG